MKISVIYPGGIQSAHCVSDGIPATLRRMGHEVLAMPMGRSRVDPITKSDLESSDLLIISGLEHFLTNESLGLKAEGLAELKVPKAAVYHESFFRADISFANFWEKLRGLADHHFFPASYDAQYFGQEHMGAPGRCHWMPFGVDTGVFHDASKSSLGQMVGIDPKTVDIGFIGSMYDERTHFVNGLANHLKGLTMNIGNVFVKDLVDVDYEATACRLASNYRRIKVFLNLPARSRLLVTKVYEVMGCGTCLLTPMLSKECERDMDLFEGGKHLIYYPRKHLGGLAQVIRELLEDETKREQIAYAGAEEIRQNHTIRHRLGTLFEAFQMQPEAKTEIAS